MVQRFETRRRPAILVVEDDPALRPLMKELWEEAGFRVAVASDGREALDILDGARPDVILLDLMMPRMTGWELVAEMRARGFDQVPIVISSALDPGFVLDTLGQRPAEVLSKPLDVDLLTETVRRVLAEV